MLRMNSCVNKLQLCSIMHSVNYVHPVDQYASSTSYMDIETVNDFQRGF